MRPLSRSLTPGEPGAVVAGLALSAAAMFTGAMFTGAFPAHAASAPRSLILTVEQGGQDDSVTLRCDPASGPHPRSLEACKALTAVKGDPSKLPEEPRTCTREYDPVTATARGVWDGAAVNYQRGFSNRCELIRATGPLFDF
jgi:Subtilisin inhibitor-like